MQLLTLLTGSALFRRRYDLHMPVEHWACFIAPVCPATQEDFLSDGIHWASSEASQAEQAVRYACVFLCSKHYDELEEELDDDMKRRTMHLSSARMSRQTTQLAQRSSTECVWRAR